MIATRLHVGVLCVSVVAAPVAAPAAELETLQEVARIQGFLGFAFCTFTPDGQTLATVDGERRVHFWDLATFKERTPFDTKPRYATVDVNRCRFAADGKTFVVNGELPARAGGERTNEVTLIDVARAAEITHFAGKDPQLSPDGKWLAIRRGDTVVLLEAEKGRELRTIPAGPPTKSNVPHLFSPDGSLVFIAGLGGKSHLWEVATGRERARIDGFNPAFAKNAPVLATIVPGGDGKPWAERGNEPAPVTDGAPIPGCTVKLWDTATGKELSAVRGFEAPGCHINLSPDGKLLLTSPWHVVLQLTGSFELPKPAPPGGGKIGHLEIRLWDTATGRENTRFAGLTRYPRDAYFLPDGQTVVFARNPEKVANMELKAEDSELVFWDIASRKPRLILQKVGGIDSPRFSNDGTKMSAVVRDTRSRSGPLALRFWDTTSGKELVSDLDGDRFQIVASMYSNFSPDGKTITQQFPRGTFVQGVGVPHSEIRVLRLSAQPLTRVDLGKPAEPPENKPPPP